MKTLETVLATNEFMTLVLVIFDDAVKLTDQLSQSSGPLISRFDIGFQFCLGALLRRNAVGQCVELFAQIFRGAVLAVRIIAAFGIPGIGDHSLTWSAWYARALRVRTAIPNIAITIRV